MPEGTVVQTRPASVSELLVRLDGMTDDMPKRLRQCAHFTRRHLHLIAVSTVSEMASNADVAPSVYMRFCQALGFSGYSEMQALFRSNYTEFRPNYEERLANLREDGAISTPRLLADFAEVGHKSLVSINNAITSEILEQTAEGLAAARVIHLVGLRRAFPVVSNMAYLMDKMGVPVALHSGAGMLDMGTGILNGDALFAVSFSPFSQETIAFVHRVAEKGIPVFALTDSERFPAADVAECVLVAREDQIAGFRSLNASMTVSTVLAVAIKSHREQC